MSPRTIKEIARVAKTRVQLILIIKNWIIEKCISRDLIGLAAMVYEPLYHAREIATIKLCSDCSCKAKSASSSNVLDCFQ